MSKWTDLVNNIFYLDNVEWKINERGENANKHEKTKDDERKRVGCFLVWQEVQQEALVQDSQLYLQVQQNGLVQVTQV